MNGRELKERIKGTLVGCAYGDAMGMPTENMTREDILKQYPNGVETFYPSSNTAVDGREFVAGEVTDDTINTLILLNCIVKNRGRASAVLYINELKEWMAEHPKQNEVIIGRSTRRAMEALYRGERMETTGIWGTTNGASMKISPIGIISDYRKMDTLVANVFEVCYPTHNTQIAIQGASVIAALISYSLQGGGIEDIWDIALQAMKASQDKGMKRGGPKLTKRMEAVKHEVETKSEKEVIALLSDFYGTGIETIETIPVVLAILQLSGGDPIRAGKIAASIGGDTDTIGAITCAIAGAMHPEFPEHIITILETVNHISFDAFVEEILPFVNIR